MRTEFLGRHKGWVKRFWLFLFLTSLVALIANVSVQVLLQDPVDIKMALVMSLTLGIVLAIVMSSQSRQLR